VLLDAEGRAADVRLGVIKDEEFQALLAQVER
jgi:hypothetical protein